MNLETLDIQAALSLAKEVSLRAGKFLAQASDTSRGILQDNELHEYSRWPHVFSFVLHS